MRMCITGSLRIETLQCSCAAAANIGMKWGVKLYSCMYAAAQAASDMLDSVVMQKRQCTLAAASLCNKDVFGND